MEFLRAKEVRLISTTNGKTDEMRVYTSHDMSQTFYASMRSLENQQLQLVICFDAAHPAPKRVSLSVKQYTMKPFEVWCALYKRNKRTPYNRFKFGEIRSIFDIEEDTTRIVFELLKPEGEGRFAKVDISVNYVKFQ